jgi:hypothetical protein
VGVGVSPGEDDSLDGVDEGSSLDSFEPPQAVKETATSAAAAILRWAECTRESLM